MSPVGFWSLAAAINLAAFALFTWWLHLMTAPLVNADLEVTVKLVLGIAFAAFLVKTTNSVRSKTDLY